MEKNKYTLITIVVLLVIILPASIYGTYIHYKTTTNFKRQFKFNGKLYFYDDKKLLGTYTCKTDDCDYAYYQSEEKSSLIHNNYAFIKDGEKIGLVNVKAGDVVETYDAVDKTIENIFYVMKNEKWGAIQITTAPVTKISLDNGYDMVEYYNRKFIVSKDSVNMISDGEKELFNTLLNIKDFNDKYVVLENSDESSNYYEELIYDYDNNIHFINYSPIDRVLLIDDYVLIKKSYNYTLVRVIDGQDQEINGFYYDGEKDLDYEIKDDSITFRDDQGFEQIIQLNVEITNE